MYADAVLSVFSQRYADARNSFVDKVETSSIVEHIDHIEHPEKGPKGEKLFCDVVWTGNPKADNVLVLVSGLHGVEGGVGSAIQADFASRHRRLPSDVCVVLIHALNPWGFAWASRSDHQGIDVNRNFIDFDNPPNGSKTLEIWQGLESGKTALADVAEDKGQFADLAQGQYEQADAPFYGGQSQSWSRAVIEKVIDELELKKRKQVMVVDIHSGLGPYGYGDLICDHPVDSAAAKKAHDIFGSNVTEPALGNSSFGEKHGLHDFFWHQQGEHICFLILEFGAFGNECLLKALLDDYALQKNGGVDWSDQETLDVKHAMQDCFCPDEKQWQELVLFRGRQIIEKSIDGLSSEKKR